MLDFHNVPEILPRLDHLRETIQSDDFLNGRGLANEVNIRIFAYDPKDELTVREWVENRNQERHLRCHLHVCNLYSEFLEALQEKRNDIFRVCAEVEEREGKEVLLQALQELMEPKEISARIVAQNNLQAGSDVLLICGVGEAYPFLRMQALLEALQNEVPNHLPIVVMYPGGYNGQHLTLFNKLAPNGYYRAFTLI